MKGYKLFNWDWTCKGFQYEVGKTYEMEESPVICEKGFHFCTKLEDCFNYYEAVSWNRIAEVEGLGECVTHDDDSKVATNKIKVVREIQWSELGGINWSKGINGSKGINESYGINGCFGLLNCQGIHKSIFCTNQSGRFLLFNKQVDEARIDTVFFNLTSALKGWEPTFNNLKSLYLKVGSDWSRTPIPNAEEISKVEAWKDMPESAINYLKSLPEFDADIFREITGIEEEKA